MSDELRELYQEVIIDHGRHPRNFRRLEPCSHRQEGFNPLCGDRLELYLQVTADEGGEACIRDIAFVGEGCAISMASASLLTEVLKGRPVAEAEALFEQFHQLLTGSGQADQQRLGKLRVLAGVREFPTRIKCATLAWHALKGALQGALKEEGAPAHWVSTE